jgi:erythromycin esterase-like protein
MPHRLVRLAVLAATLWAAGAMAVQPLTGGDRDYDALLALTANTRAVMLGEATHGSREFYRERMRITRRLIAEQGFGALAIEAPWEPVRRVDAYIRGEGRDADADAALADFIHFPDWTWRNSEMRDFVEELRALNRTPVRRGRPVRLYGMDVYSVPESADAVVRHLARRSVVAAVTARQRYRCFDDYRHDPWLYGRNTEAGKAPSCAAGAALQLAELASATADEDDFLAWQSARVVSNGESYYRAMHRDGPPSWNVRERHMADTLTQLLERMGPRGRIVVWAHNLHQGDARATDQARGGEVSIGQLMRERYGDAAVLVGLSTWRGHVRAAPEWGARDRVRRLRPALADSWHGRLHRRGPPDALLIFRGNPALTAEFGGKALERAVGVLYLPADERKNHYFHAALSAQFDAVIHLDVTTALDTLGRYSPPRPAVVPRQPKAGRSATAPR